MHYKTVLNLISQICKIFIHSPQRMNPADFDDLKTFPPFLGHLTLAVLNEMSVFI